jgi:hydrogenase-4 component F
MDTTLLLLLVTPPLVSAAAALVEPRPRRWPSQVNASLAVVPLAAAAVFAWRLAGGAPAIVVGSMWRIDALSALLALLVSGVSALAAWLGPGLSAADATPAAETRAFRVYANVFSATMLIAVCTASMGILWVAIEGSTVASALLVPMSRSKASIEASWKYLLIGSVGIALAFTGTVLAVMDYTATTGGVESALNWTVLVGAGHRLHPEVLRLAFVFLLVGFGTKAGLAPMHTWLPDAHSEAPAPLSAMMSSVLLAVGLYAVARWKVVVDVTVGSSFSDSLLLVVAVVTILIGSLSLATQRHYKRMLAYSSIEHTGLACFGLALGPLGVAAALLHLMGHALAKSTAFLLAGRVADRYGRRGIAATSGVLATLPITGGLFGASVLALVGLPPFSLFMSEVLLVRAGWAGGHPAVTGLVLVLLLIAFGSLLYHLQRMLLGDAPSGVAAGERAGVAVVVLAAPLVLLVWIGMWTPLGLQALLSQAVGALRP